MLLPLFLKAHAEVAEGEEDVFGWGGVAAHGAGAGFSVRAEAVAGGFEGFVDEGFAADDGTVGEVADAVKEDRGEGVVGEGGLVVGGF